MALSDRNRKILWALAGNSCSRCDVDLVHLPDAEGDVHAMVGRECHIVAKSLTGPRGEEDPRGGIDDYRNLILLCANCHAVIDDQPAHWTPNALRQLKRAHEEKVQRRKAPGMPELKLQGRDRPLELRRITSGDTLMGILGGAFSYVNVPPDQLSRSQREVVGDFLQSAQDWGEIHGDIGPKGHMEAGQDLQDHLEVLASEGLLVYAATRQLIMATDRGDASPWPEAVVRVVHEHDARERPAEERQAAA